MLGTLVLTAGAAYAGYRLFPEPLFNLAMASQRMRAGLSLKETFVDGHRISYLEGGRGEPLLLLHGFGANKDHWPLVARYLTPQYRVIALDIPGFGDSSRVPEASYSLDLQLNRLEEFAQTLGLGRFHLGGNSMGAYLAAMYAARKPDQVDSLWLLAPPGVAAAATSELSRYIARGDNLLLIDSETKGKRLQSMIFCKAPFVPKGFLNVWLTRALGDNMFNSKLFGELFAEPIMLDQRCAGLATRALIVWGDDDRLLDVSGAAELHKLLPNSDVRIMRGMGHCPMLERPRNTAQDFLNFHGRAL